MTHRTTDPAPRSAPARARPEPSGPSRAWRVVIPVKSGRGAKSRLRPPDGVDRLVLARALALDTVLAACAAVGPEHVLVVTSDAELAGRVHASGVGLVPDPGTGLNTAVRAGMASALRAGDGSWDHGPVAALLGDLPALRVSELQAALATAKGYPSAFVPDAEGGGTVLLAVRDATAVWPRFGSGSAAAHGYDGHVRLDLDLPGLRRDVDDEESLREALRLGVGPHTARLLAHLIGAS